jgi:hypothetical protein
VARDAAARLYDVDASSILLDKKAGTITFQAKPGRLIDLDRLHESIWATRLGDGTGMILKDLIVTAAGEVAMVNGDVILKVAGSEQQFVLDDDANLRKIREALGRGEKVISVTGRVQGWEGNFTKFLGKLPPKPRRITVREFKTAPP